jgi:hypothetical protein
LLSCNRFVELAPVEFLHECIVRGETIAVGEQTFSIAFLRREASAIIVA